MDSQGNSWRSFCGVLIWCWLQWSLKLSLSANSGQWVSKFYFQNTTDLLRVHCSDMIVKLFFCLVKLPAWKKTFLTVNSVVFFFSEVFSEFSTVSVCSLTHKCPTECSSNSWGLWNPQGHCDRVQIRETPEGDLLLSWRWLWPPSVSNTEYRKCKNGSPVPNFFF